MAKEDLGKLSPEQLKKLAATISEAKSLTSQQAEIIEQVLSGEHDIGKLRISYLEQYFDKYSKGLDKVARKYRDDLDDTFQILDKKLAESYKTLKDNPSKTDSKKTSSAKKEPSTAVKRETGSSAQDSKLTKELVSVLRDLSKQLKTRYTPGIENTSTSGITSNKSGSTANDGSRSSAGANTTTDTSATSGVSVVSDTQGDDKTNQLEVLRLSDKQAVLAEERSERIKRLNEDIYDTEERLIFASELAKKGSEERFKELRLKHNKEVAEAKLTLVKTNEQLAFETAEGYNNRLEELRLSQEQKVASSALELQELINASKAEAAYYQTDEGADLRAQEEATKAKIAFEKKETEKLNAWKAVEEAKSRAKNNGELTAAEIKRINKAAEAKKKLDEANFKKAQERDDKERARKAKLEQRKDLNNIVTAPLSKENTLLDRFGALKEHTQNKITPDENGNISKGAGAIAALDTAVAAISDLVKQLENTVDKIGSYKGNIDTRLQGSKNNKRMGSYWDQLVVDMTSVGAVTPFFKQEDFANNIKELVNKGISFDLKQRAFLMTIQEKIANTFNVADGTLLRLIRIQQEDSTAGRLGMESALNSFLNNMYETTEYLTDVASSVRGSLQEMEALMSGAAATEVEYQVQKWMGSLYSVGMSQEAVQSIASTLGQIAAGQVEGLTNGSGAGNLLVMAANKSGKSIADILTEGLDATETNELLQATVNYLAEIAESTKGNNVVQQQIAGVFGVKASDLRAATNLKSDPSSKKNSINDIYNKNLSYDNMLNQLFSMAGSMASRTSIAEMMTNIWANGQYTLAGSMANNPISYLLFKMSSLLEQTTGGISLPFLNVMGFGVDLETTVADLMRVAAMSGGIMSSLGSMIGGLGRSFSGKAMLRSLGIDEGNGLQINTRGGSGVGASPLDSNQSSPSESGYVGNANSSDIKDSTMQSANDDKKKQMIKAKEEEPSNQVDVLNYTVLKIYELLDDVATGSKALRVKIDNYGLTGSGVKTGSSSLTGNNSSSLGENSSSGESLISGSSSSSDSFGGNYSNGSSSTGGGVNLGGWTLV